MILSDATETPDLMAEALSERAGRKVELLVPQRGEKAELVAGALRNARESLARRMAESATQTKLLKGLADAFGLDAPPQRIEVYDNSHIMGTNAVGAMIVAGPEGFMKNQYRKFNIRGDDLTPDGDGLIVANQGADSLAVFRLEEGTGEMIPRQYVENVPTPTCVAFHVQ